MGPEGRGRKGGEGNGREDTGIGYRRDGKGENKENDVIREANGIGMGNELPCLGLSSGYAPGEN